MSCDFMISNMDIKRLKTLFYNGTFAMLATIMLIISVVKLQRLGQTILSQPVLLNNTKQPTSNFLQGKPAFVIAEKASAYLFSALKHFESMSNGNVGKMEPNYRNMSEQFVITGWYVSKHRSKITVGMKCCFCHNDGRFSSGTGKKRETPFDFNGTHFNVLQYVCPVHTTNPVIKISITERSSKCSTNITHYIDVEETKQQKIDGVALLGKVLYGKLSASYLVEWFEAQRFLGVDKIFCYIHAKLNNVAKNVVKYYEEMGLAKSAEFEVPENDLYPRLFEFYPQIVNIDFGVTILDWQERMKEYKYAIHLDTDEILIPENVTLKNSLKRYLVDRFQSNNTLSLMYFLTMVHMKVWNAANPNHQLLIGRQSNSTIAMRDRQKYAFKSEGVIPGSCSSHECRIKQGYKSEFIRDNSAVIHHFRNCRAEWKKIARKNTLKDRRLFINNPHGKVCDSFKRIRSLTTEKLADQIKQDVLNVRSLLNIG